MDGGGMRESGWLFQLRLEVPPPLMFPMTVTALGRDQDCSLKNREPDVRPPWILDPGGWSKVAAVGLYFIFPGICTLSLLEYLSAPKRLECREDGSLQYGIHNLRILTSRSLVPKIFSAKKLFCCKILTWTGTMPVNIPKVILTRSNASDSGKRSYVG
ncbi:hypothetical protein STEG23_017576 [Scotinomys teguina]